MHICSLVFVAASSVVVEGLLLGPGAALRPAQPQLARQVRLSCHPDTAKNCLYNPALAR